MINRNETLDSIKKTVFPFLCFRYIVFPFQTVQTQKVCFRFSMLFFGYVQNMGQHARQYILWIVWFCVQEYHPSFESMMMICSSHNRRRGIIMIIIKERKKHLLNRTCPWTGGVSPKWFPIMNNCSDRFEVIELA